MNIQIHRLSYSYPVKIQYNIISMHICIFFYSGTSQSFFLGNLNKRAKVVILHIKGLANQVCTIILATPSSDSVACVERAGSRISEKWEKIEGVRWDGQGQQERRVQEGGTSDPAVPSPTHYNISLQMTKIKCWDGVCSL